MNAVALEREQSHRGLVAFVDSMPMDERTQKVDLSREPLAIDCPDCGPQMAFNGRCPKCCGDSWMPRGKRVNDLRGR